ncbi:hypothetical protein BpHYR1_001059 [Brachionus plicatilis]|uniref:Uncharacterized protein n=1 Tax=Brachionus plicatilis TaxID=10195 RepID=A0A3M7QNZ2_BRAPC|nr:hypothetical protein BpHYR1_001059 [Brachionus plicatilis]
MSLFQHRFLHHKVNKNVPIWCEFKLELLRKVLKWIKEFKIMINNKIKRVKIDGKHHVNINSQLNQHSLALRQDLNNVKENIQNNLNSMQNNLNKVQGDVHTPQSD